MLPRASLCYMLFPLTFSLVNCSLQVLQSCNSVLICTEVVISLFLECQSLLPGPSPEFLLYSLSILLMHIGSSTQPCPITCHGNRSAPDSQLPLLVWWCRALSHCYNSIPARNVPTQQRRQKIILQT